MSEEKDTQQEEKQEPKGEYTLTVGEYSCELNSPDRKTIGEAHSFINPFDGSKPNFVLAGEVIVRNSFVAGDQEILTSDKLMASAALEAISLFKLEDTELKKN